ncbi:MAG: Gfo/Idh/MocA family oxidoreductase [Gordonia sp. (in: high G+C Gram-positive bacteria)]|uniref:Gfo/Idh/MocA family protein n=1 Tax=Gordonia sp. (in: high G+C Gram-positive bacteria) TaxID=84139 RepID=UPI003BB701FC
MSELRVGVVGTGTMGSDHVRRLTRTTTGARVSVVVEPDRERRTAALAVAPGAVGMAGLDEALAAGVLDAVLIAAPGPQHESTVAACVRAGLPTLCEKPLTPDPESAWRLVEAERAGGRRLIQVGFMRRYDVEYAALRARITEGRSGELLMIHAVHRNAGTPVGYAESMLITDSVVHELDAVPWLAGSPITSIEVRRGRPNPRAAAGLREPILVLLRLADGTLADVEMNVLAASYQVITEAVLAGDVVRIGDVGHHADYTTRFAEAYDREVQAWVDSVAAQAISGPSAWDGYVAAVCCRAGVQALTAEGPVVVDLPPRPTFYA